MNPSLIAELVAKQAITDVLHRYARAMDRMDKALALTCWHPGGTDRHSPLFDGTAEQFVEWLWPVHAAMLTTTHRITNALIELHGEHAGCESYYSVTLRIPSAAGVFDMRGQGRYLDRFERIDGRWAIRHREAVNDWSRVDPMDYLPGDPRLPALIEPQRTDIPVLQSRRDRDDPSYRVLSGLFGLGK